MKVLQATGLTMTLVLSATLYVGTPPWLPTVSLTTCICDMATYRRGVVCQEMYPQFPVAQPVAWSRSVGNYKILQYHNSEVHDLTIAMTRICSKSLSLVTQLVLQQGLTLHDLMLHSSTKLMLYNALHTTEHLFCQKCIQSATAVNFMKWERVPQYTCVYYGSSHYYTEQYSLFHIIFRHHTCRCSILCYNPLEKKNIKNHSTSLTKRKTCNVFSIW